MEKTLSLEIELCEGPKEKDTFVFSRVNEDIAGAGAGEKGTLAFLITVKALPEQDVTSLAKDLGNSFETKYLESKKGTVLASLEEALAFLQEIAVSEQLSLEMVTAVIWGPILYIGKLGQGQIFLWRNGSAQPIDFKFVASGQLHNGETVCLSNSIFGEVASQQQLSLMLGRETLSEVKKKLDEILSEKAGGLCLLIRIKLEETPLSATQVEFVDTDKLASSTSLKALPKKSLVKLKEVLVIIRTKTTPAFSSLKKFFARYFNRLAQPWRKRLPGEIHDERSRRRERFIQIGVVLGVLLVLSIAISVLRSEALRQQKALSSLVQQIEENLTKAKSASSTEQGTTYLASLNSLLEKAEKENLSKEKLSKFQAEYDELLAANKHIYKLEELSQVVDLGKSNLKAEKITLAGADLVALTTDGKKLYKIELSSGKLTSLSSALDSGVNLTSEEKSVFVFGKDSLWKLDLEKPSLNKVLSSQTSWGEIVSAASYNSNIYLLDKSKNEVWKYLAGTAGLGSARSYFANPKPTFTDPISLAVDGALWVATKQGAVFKFVAGKRQDFHLSSPPEGLSIKQIVTDQKTKNLYLLDAENARIVVFSKEGSYLASYQGPLLSGASSFTVNEETKTVWFVSSSKVYQFKLR